MQKISTVISLFTSLRLPHSCTYTLRKQLIQQTFPKNPHITTCSGLISHPYPSLPVSVSSSISHPPLPPFIHLSIMQEVWPSWKQVSEHVKSQGRGGLVREGEQRMFLSFPCLSGCSRPRCSSSWGSQSHVTLAKPWARTCCLVGPVWRSTASGPNTWALKDHMWTNTTFRNFPSLKSRKITWIALSYVVGKKGKTMKRTTALPEQKFMTLPTNHTPYPVCNYCKLPTHLQVWEFISMWFSTDSHWVIYRFLFLKSTLFPKEDAAWYSGKNITQPSEIILFLIEDDTKCWNCSLFFSTWYSFWILILTFPE